MTIERPEYWIPGNRVVEFLRSNGATKTDAEEAFPGNGRHGNNIAQYIELMETGDWWESKRPIILDALTGTVWLGTDRTVAISRVNWKKVKKTPMFRVIVERPRPGEPLKETAEEREGHGNEE